MTASTKLRLDLARGIAIGCVVALLLTAALWWAFSAAAGTKVTAYFANGVGVYPGGTVRVLGVPIGSIDEVTPQDKQVKVAMTVEDGVTLPANPTAVVILPSVVSDRYIQLPPYHGGAKAGKNTVIGLDRTRTPTEIDDAYRTLDKLSQTLGPNGANKKGALSDVLNTGAANLAGNGQNIAQTLQGLSKAAETLNNSKGDLFGTVKELAKFTTMLQKNDAQVQDFSKRVTDVTGFLDDERGELTAAVKDLAPTLAKVKEFVGKNRGGIKSNVDNLTKVSKTIADNRGSLAETMDLAPLALNNLLNAYNASSGTLDARPALQELTDPPLTMLCTMIKNFDHSKLPQDLGKACQSVADIVQGIIPLPPLSSVITALRQGKLPQLPKPALNALESASQNEAPKGGK
ncbi:MCE family protein [Sciscionella sediminilitoris]|uniref:MCE family protein n=1 Tax=Sciscionella sediminilitoris TaxID=1445613 RepID=UPI0004DECF01|nr:MCE family protein [Sciscionella sp. SE31]